MVRRIVQLIALATAVVVALGAGSYVRDRTGAPDPVAVARAATRAYAAGDCQALREVSSDPGTVDCAAVAQVRDAYRAEGLEPETFRYELVRSGGRDASVRITYEREGRPGEEIVELRRHGSDWKVLPVPLAG